MDWRAALAMTIPVDCCGGLVMTVRVDGAMYHYPVIARSVATWQSRKSGNPRPYRILSYKSCQCGFSCSISAILRFLEPALSCFSRAIAPGIVSCRSNHTSV